MPTGVYVDDSHPSARDALVELDDFIENFRPGNADEEFVRQMRTENFIRILLKQERLRLASNSLSLAESRGLAPKYDPYRTPPHVPKNLHDFIADSIMCGSLGIAQAVIHVSEDRLYEICCDLGLIIALEKRTCLEKDCDDVTKSLHARSVKDRKKQADRLNEQKRQIQYLKDLTKKYESGVSDDLDNDYNEIMEMSKKHFGEKRHEEIRRSLEDR